MQFVKEKCNCHKLEVDQKIGFTFVESYIELSLSDSVPDGWRLDPHTEPLKASFVYVMTKLSLHNSVYL